MSPEQDDDAIRGLEAKAVGVFPRSVLDREGPDLHVGILIDNARQDLVHLDLIAGRVGLFESLDPDADVL